MPTLSSIIAPGGVATENNELNLQNKTLINPVVAFANGGKINVPSGTTGERPVDPVSGSIRFNTDEIVLERYDGSNWNTIELTDQEIRSLFNGGGDLTYDSATGTFSVTTPQMPVQIPKPVPVNPIDQETDIGESPTLDAGDYYHLYDRPHTLSRFQVSDDDQFSNIIYDSGEIAATETHTVPAGNLLEGQVTYYWRAYYEDDAGNESDWSDTQSFVTADSFFDATDPANIGQPYAGGYLVGVIDTVAGTIDSQDDYQTGLRYALVVAPKALENGTVPPWDTQDRAGEAGAITRWNGLESTNTILAKNDTSYEAFEHIRSIRSSNPAPAVDGGSEWYLPAMDELELIYRNLKPVARDNNVGTRTEDFPGSQDFGFNPSSDPQGSAYTANDPAQTTLTDFQDGGPEAVDLDRYWTSTDADDSGGQAWYQVFGSFGNEGYQDVANKNDTRYSVRPVRRVVL